MIGMTLCSGIGAPELAAPWVDWRLASEIEPFPRAVLQERFGYKLPGDQSQGEPLLWGDMTEITPDLMRARGLPLPDLIVAGTPCQDFSIAGLRAGTDGGRGNLTLKFVETCHAIVDARPDGKLAVLWENVPGILSDRGNAFGNFMGGLVGADHALLPADREWGWIHERLFITEDGDGDADGRSIECASVGGAWGWKRISWPSEGMVQGPRARLAWCVLDAQWFGVAQRRRRVFVVIDFGGACDPAKILLEPDRVRGDPPSRGKEGQNVAGTVAPCLRARENASHRLDTEAYVAVEANSGDVAYCLTASAQQSLDAETETLIAQCATGETSHALTAEGHDASEDGTGRGTPVIAFSSKDHGADAMNDLCPTLRAGGHAGSHANAGLPPAVAFAIQERAVSENPDAGPDGAGFRDDDAAFTLEARTTAQAVAFDLRGRDGGAQLEGPHDTANLRAASGGSSRSYVSTPQVRRLMPVECAHLQGFPDDHCAITYRGKPAADGPQYKAYGNSMAVPCVRWIMDRMKISMEESA